MNYRSIWQLSKLLPLMVCLSAVAILGSISRAQDTELFRPDQSVLPTPAPQGAIVLLDSKGHQFLSMSGKAIDWTKDENCLVATKSENRVNHVVSQWHFCDADIHVEFMVSEIAEGNSGIYIHGNYELQIFNSYGKKEITEHDQGALYGFSKPLVNASKKPGEWQVYDIRFRAPRRDENGKITKTGSVTAWLNGQLVQDNTTFEEPRSVYHPFRYGTTDYLKKIWKQQLATQVGPVFLQDHGSPTRFRNVWIKPLDDKAILYKNEG
jgi:hypothetical protein